MGKVTIYNSSTGKPIEVSSARAASMLGRGYQRTAPATKNNGNTKATATTSTSTAKATAPANSGVTAKSALGTLLSGGKSALAKNKAAQKKPAANTSTAKTSAGGNGLWTYPMKDQVAYGNDLLTPNVVPPKVDVVNDLKSAATATPAKKFGEVEKPVYVSDLNAKGAKRFRQMKDAENKRQDFVYDAGKAAEIAPKASSTQIKGLGTMIPTWETRRTFDLESGTIKPVFINPDGTTTTDSHQAYANTIAAEKNYNTQKQIRAAAAKGAKRAYHAAIVKAYHGLPKGTEYDKDGNIRYKSGKPFQLQSFKEDDVNNIMTQDFVNKYVEEELSPFIKAGEEEAVKNLLTYKPDATMDEQIAARGQANLDMKSGASDVAYSTLVDLSKSHTRNDYFDRYFSSQNILGKILGGKKSYFQNIREQGLMESDEIGGVAKALTSAATVTLDPMSWVAFGPASGWAAKLATPLLSRALGAAASRLGGGIATTVGNSLLAGTGRVAIQSTLGSMVGFGLYDAMGNVGEQISAEGKVNPWEVVNAGGKGMALGAAVGVTGAMVKGMTNSWVAKAGKTGSKAKVVAAKAAGKATEFGSETAVFAAPDAYAALTDERVSDKEAALKGSLLKNALTLGAFKVVGVGNKLVQMATKPGESIANMSPSRDALRRQTSLWDRISTGLTTVGENGMLTKEEWKELHDAGYGDLSKLLSKEEVEETRAALGKLDSGFDPVAATRVKKLGDECYGQLARLLIDKNVSQSARTKIATMVTGKKINLVTPVVKVETRDTDDGGVQVVELSQSGEKIRVRDFDDAQSAQSAVAKAQEEAVLNTTAMAEERRTTKALGKAQSEAIVETAKKFNTTVQAVKRSLQKVAFDEAAERMMTELNNRKRKKDKTAKITEADIPKTAAPADHDIAAAVAQIFERNLNDEKTSDPDVIAQTIKEKTGVDVDKAMSKPDSERTDQEREAIESYIQQLNDPTYAGEEWERVIEDAHKKLWGDSDSKLSKAQEQGRNASDQERAQALNALQLAKERAEKALGMTVEEYCKEQSPEEVVNTPGQKEKLGEEKYAALSAYAEAQSLMKGVNEAIEKEAQGHAEAAGQFVDRLLHDQSGNIHQITTTDGRTLYVVNGEVKTQADGRSIDVDESSPMLVVHNPKTDKRETLSPMDVTEIKMLSGSGCREKTAEATYKKYMEDANMKLTSEASRQKAEAEKAKAQEAEKPKSVEAEQKPEAVEAEQKPTPETSATDDADTNSEEATGAEGVSSDAEGESLRVGDKVTYTDAEGKAIEGEVKEIDTESGALKVKPLSAEGAEELFDPSRIVESELKRIEKKPQEPKAPENTQEKTEIESESASEKMIGRPLTQEESVSLIEVMKRTSEKAEDISLSPEAWDAMFGEDGKVSTPVGEVKMGEHQYLKLLKNKRDKYFGMIKPTLQRPDMVLEEYDPKEGAERDTKLLFIKTFEKPDGSRYVHFESVTVQRDNMEVSISSHELTPEGLNKKMQHDKVLHLDDRFLSSEGRLTEPHEEGSDLVPSPNRVSSEGKDSNFTSDKQEKSEGSLESVAKKASPAEDFVVEGDADATYEGAFAQAGGNQAVLDRVLSSRQKKAQKALDDAKKAVDKAKRQLKKAKEADIPDDVADEFEAAQAIEDAIVDAQHALDQALLQRSQAKDNVDFWDRVASTQERRAKAEEDEIEKAVDTILEDAGMDKYEYVAHCLASRSHKITPESFTRMTGYGATEMRQMVGMIAKRQNGGHSIETVAQHIWESDPQHQYFGDDDKEVQDILLEVLQEGNPRSYVNRHRLERREKIKSDLLAERNIEREEYAQAAYGMSWEEYEAYEEERKREMAALHKNFDETEYNDILADEYANRKEREDETRETESATERQDDGSGGDILHQQEPAQPLREADGSSREPRPETRDSVSGAGTSGAVAEESGAEAGRGDIQSANERREGKEEIADNGTPFVVSANGTTTFGEITEDCGLQAAPIKLSEGFHDEATGKGNGLKHIEHNHGKQIRDAGFSSVAEFVSFVAEKYDHDNIRVGERREDGSPTYLIQVTNEHDNTLFIELSKDGKYWNVNSGGIFRKGYSNKKETVAKTEPQQPNNAVSSDSSLSKAEHGGKSTSEPNGKSTVSISSEGKGNASVEEKQGKGAESSGESKDFKGNKDFKGAEGAEGDLDFDAEGDEAKGAEAFGADIEAEMSEEERVRRLRNGLKRASIYEDVDDDIVLKYADEIEQVVRLNQEADRLYDKLFRESKNFSDTDEANKKSAEHKAYVEAREALRSKLGKEARARLKEQLMEGAAGGVREKLSKVKPPTRKITSADVVSKDKNQPIMTGVYYDNGHIVATDARLLVALNGKYPKENEGKVITPKGEVVEGHYPAYERILNQSKEGATDVSEALKSSHDTISRLVKLVPEGKDNVPSAVVMVGDVYYNAHLLWKALSIAKANGIADAKILQSGWILMMEGKNGRIALMGVIPGEESVIYDVSGDRMRIPQSIASLSEARSSKAIDALREHLGAEGSSPIEKQVGVSRTDNEPSQEQKALGHAAIEIVRDAGIDVVTDKERVQKAYDSLLTPEMRSNMAMMEEAKRKPSTKPASGKNATPTSGERSSRAKVGITDENRKDLAEKVGAIHQSIATGITSEDFLRLVKNAFGFDDVSKSDRSEYAVNVIDDSNHTMRISNHHATAGTYKEHGELNNNTALVIKMSDKRFKKDKAVSLVEYVYFPDRLTPEKMHGIVNGLKDWVEHGEYTHQEYDDRKVSGYDNPLQAMTAWHGSPHTFEGFDSAHMGSGEGAQAHGWGHYVAFSEETGKGYAKALGGKTILFKGAVVQKDGSARNWVITNMREWLEDGLSFESAKEKIIHSINGVKWDKKMKDTASEVLNNLRPEDFETRRNLYEVEIPDDDGSNYLYENNEYSRDEAQGILNRYNEANGTNYTLDDNPHWLRWKTIEGRDLYTGLVYFETGNANNSGEGVSKGLSKAGFVGIRYDGRRDGQCAVIFNEKDLKIKNRTQFLRTPAGEVYGFVKDGKIYIDPDLINPETPIHEYTHLWDKAVQESNPELWARGKELMKQLPLWEEVKNDPAYEGIAADENLVASEVHSRLSGVDGAKQLDQMVEAARSKGMVETAKAVTLRQQIKAWLKDVYTWVRDAFSGKWGKKELESLTVEEFASMPIKDLARGLNPNDIASHKGIEINRSKVYEKISNFEPKEIIERIKDSFWEGTSVDDRLTTVKYLQSSPEGLEVLDRLNRHNGTPWAKAAINSVLVRMSLEDMLSGRKPRVQSMLTYPNKRGRVHGVVKLIERRGADGVWHYLLDKGIIGNAAKCVNNVNGSYVSCRPSDNCAKFCYASKGNSASRTSIVKNELIRWAVITDPKRVADMIARQYMAKGEWLLDDGKALRLFEAGDLDESWLPVIEELNRRGIVTQIFSKNPEVLERVDRKQNVMMLSVDASNLHLLDEHPDLPIAFVYASEADLQALERCRERFERNGGVILPVVEGNKVLSQEALMQLPQWTHPYQCPIDNGQRKIVNKQQPELSWNCTKCDAKGGVGCFFKRTAKQLKERANDLRRDDISRGNGGMRLGVTSRNAEGVLGRNEALSNSKESARRSEVRGRLLRIFRAHGIPDALITPELLEDVDSGLRGDMGSWRSEANTGGVSEGSSEPAGVSGRTDSAGSGSERGSGIDSPIQFQILGENDREGNIVRERRGKDKFEGMRSLFDLDDSPETSDERRATSGLSSETSDQSPEVSVKRFDKLAKLSDEEKADEREAIVGRHEEVMLELEESRGTSDQGREMQRTLRVLDDLWQQMTAMYGENPTDEAAAIALSSIEGDIRRTRLSLLAEARQELTDRGEDSKDVYITGRGRAIAYESMVDDLTRERSGELDHESGEFCLVERVFIEKGDFNFMTGEKIESAADVAYIFSSLEDAAKEHAFVVLVKDGTPTVVELGMGTFSASPADNPTAMLAYERIKPDEVYFVHNHPSGTLVCSQQDKNALQRMKDMFDVPTHGVIINLKSGKYGTFTTEGKNDVGDKRIPKQQYPLKVHTLDKQIFAADYDPMAQPMVGSSDDIASFLNSHRMGDRAKLSFLILNRANKIVGNIHTPFTSLEGKEEEIGRYISQRVTQFGGEGAVLYGDFPTGQDANGTNLRKIKEAMSRRDCRLIDAVKVDGRNTWSAFQNGLMEPATGYGRKKSLQETRQGSGVGDSVIERARAIVRQQRDQEQKPQKNAAPSHTELLSKAAAKAQRAMMRFKTGKGGRADSEKSLQAARDAVAAYIKTGLARENMPQVRKSELSRMLDLVKKASTRPKLESHLREAERILHDVELRSRRRDIDGLLKSVTSGRNSKGISIGKGVDDATRKAIQAIRAGLKSIMLTDVDADLHDIGSELWHLQRARKSLLDSGDSPELLSEIEERIEGLKAERDSLKAQRDSKRDENVGEMDQAWADKLKALEAKIADSDAETDPYLISELEALRIMKLINDVSVLESVGEVDSDGNHTSISLREAEAEIERLRESRKSAPSKAEVDRQIAQQELVVNSIKEKQAQLLREAEEKLRAMVEGGRESLQTQIQAERDRQSHIVKNVYDDIKRGKEWKQRGFFSKKLKDMDKRAPLKKFLYNIGSPLHSMAYLCNKLSTSMSGMGWMFRNFIEGKDGLSAAHDALCRAQRRNIDMLDNKVTELLGIGEGVRGKAQRLRNGLSPFYEAARKYSKVESDTGVYTYHTDSEGNVTAAEQEMSKGTAMYLHQLWGMTDGRMKLEGMGYTAESIEQIDAFIGDKLVELADWMVDEFYPQIKTRLNERHKEIYLTSLAEVDNYVPIHIDPQLIKKQSDMASGDASTYSKSLQKVNGSLVNRTVNTLGIDMSRTAFDVLAEHANKNEEWIAYSRLRKDLDYVMSSNAIRNTMNANARGAFLSFEKEARTAVFLGDRIDSPTDSVVNLLSAGLVSGATSFRWWVALKQLLSYPAFFGYSQRLEYLTLVSTIWANPVGNWKWAKQNLPSFAKRIEDGFAGSSDLMREIGSLNEGKFKRLLTRYNRIGMKANKLIDGITCAAGARSVYIYEHKRLKNKYIKKGMDEKTAEMEARAAALRKADIAYNETQQSNVSAFKSTAQCSTTAASRLITVFQQANLGYTRKNLLAWDDLKETTLHFDRVVKRRMELFGEDEKTAKKEVFNRCRKAVVEIGLYGYGVKALWDMSSTIAASALALVTGNSLPQEDDDDHDEDATDTKMLNLLCNYAGYWLQGTMSGNFLHDLMSGGYNPTSISKSKELDEIKKVWDEYGGLSKETIVQTLRAMGDITGFKPDTWANIIIGVDDMVEKGFDADIAMDVMLILNCPKSMREEVVNSRKGNYSPMEYARAMDFALKRKNDDSISGLMLGYNKSTKKHTEESVKAWINQHAGADAVKHFAEIKDAAVEINNNKKRINGVSHFGFPVGGNLEKCLPRLKSLDKKVGTLLSPLLEAGTAPSGKEKALRDEERLDKSYNPNDKTPRAIDDASADKLIRLRAAIYKAGYDLIKNKKQPPMDELEKEFSAIQQVVDPEGFAKSEEAERKKKGGKSRSVVTNDDDDAPSHTDE